MLLRPKLERLNKEFKRRTKSKEIVVGESSCYNMLAVISLRMEIIQLLFRNPFLGLRAKLNLHKKFDSTRDFKNY